MPRPAGFHPDMIGLVKLPSSRMPAPPRTDPSEQYLAGLANVCGVRLTKGAPLAPPARTMFPAGPDGDAAFDTHLEALSQRLLAAMKNVATRQPTRTQSKKQQRSAIYRAGKRISWLDLRLVSCGTCRRALLGPSDECVREHARLCRSRALAELPPPVAGRIHDQPLCAACHMAATRTSRRVPA